MPEATGSDRIYHFNETFMKICLFLAPKTDKFLKDAVEVIETSRLQVAKQVNNVVMSSYWKIGKLLEDRKIDSKHDDGIVKRLSIDLKSKYPNMGLSQRNLWDMKKFYLRYHQCNIKLRQAVAVLPWSHNLILMSYDLSTEYVEFYASEIQTKVFLFSYIRYRCPTQRDG